MKRTRRPLDWGWVLGLMNLAFGAAMGAGASAMYGFGPAGAAAALAVGGLLFGWLGVSLVRRSIASNRETLERNRRMRAHPEEPWRWLPEWEGNRSTQLDPHFGTTVLELRTMPVRVGGVLDCLIYPDLKELPPAGFTLHLVALETTRSTRRGRSRRAPVGPTTLWTEHRAVQATPTAGGLVIEVAVEIPAGLPPTDDSSLWREVNWLMGVAADVGERQYHAQFRLPVFLP